MQEYKMDTFKGLFIKGIKKIVKERPPFPTTLMEYVFFNINIFFNFQKHQKQLLVFRLFEN